jgi:RNA polymerase sigma-70 factor (ECF subfamily)
MTLEGTPSSAADGGRASGTEISDHRLLEQLQQGSQDAATELYRRYAHRLRALARSQCSSALAGRVEADDIVQSVFRTFFRHASRGVYDVPSGGELWKLFLVITLNKVRAEGEYHTAAKRDVRVTSRIDPEDQDQQGQLRHDERGVGFLQLVIDEQLRKLPAPHRRIVQLRIDGWDLAEIASETHRSKRTVERVLQDFRGSLRAILEKDD